jgi:DNA repair exonuclease SbcCD ATPase subunit
MEISLSFIKKVEYHQVLKQLSINELRQPFINDNKLWKRRISGFGPQAIPCNILSIAYYEEIKSGNSILQKYLISKITKYLKDKKVFDYIENSDEHHDVLKWIDFGYKLSKANCEIPGPIVLKLFSFEVTDKELDYIQYGFEMMEKEKIENEQRINALILSNQELEAKISELTSKLDMTNSQKISLGEHLQEIKKSEEQLKNENFNLLDKLSNSETLIHRIEKELQETTNENRKLQLSCKSYFEEISELKQQLNETENIIKNLNQKLAESNKEKLYEYEVTIKRIAGEVIEELNIELDISKQEFTELCQKLDADLNLVNVWNSIFSKDNRLITYTEDVMRSNNVTISDLDNLDELENNIIFKYIIIKSLKALFFEYLSIMERRESIASRFKTNSL